MNTPEERAAYINSQSACAMIRAMGMVAENEQAKADGFPTPKYTEKHFEQIMVEFGITHNAVIGYLTGR